MRKTRKLNLIIQILLMFSIMLSVLSIFVKYVVLDENTYLNIFNKNNTYGQLKDSIYEKIDTALNAKNIKIDIKESIITEDDIKSEVNNAISGVIEYLKTGENNVKPIDTQIYKQRVADVLHSIIGNAITPVSNELSYNDNLKAKNMVSSENKLQFSHMVVTKEKSKDGQGTLDVQKLMTKEEAEARVRELLKEKGLTVDQAIQKAQQKGITEEQALKILAGYGITIDDEPSSEGSSADDSNNVQGQADNGTQEKTSGDDSSSNQSSNSSSDKSSEEGISSNNNNQSPADKSIKSGLGKIESKLLDEAGKSIEKEVEKVNFNKVLESGKFQTLAKITSTIYKMFWLFMILPIIFMVILIKINDENLFCGLRKIRSPFLLTGLVLCGVFFGAYVLKIYEKINIIPIYFKETIFYTIKHFLIVLSTYGIVVFLIGLVLFMLTIKKNGN